MKSIHKDLEITSDLSSASIKLAEEKHFGARCLSDDIAEVSKKLGTFDIDTGNLSAEALKSTLRTVASLQDDPGIAVDLNASRKALEKLIESIN